MLHYTCPFRTRLGCDHINALYKFTITLLHSWGCALGQPMRQASALVHKGGMYHLAKEWKMNECKYHIADPSWKFHNNSSVFSVARILSFVRYPCGLASLCRINMFFQNAIITVTSLTYTVQLDNKFIFTAACSKRSVDFNVHHSVWSGMIKDSLHHTSVSRLCRHHAPCVLWIRLHAGHKK